MRALALVVLLLTAACATGAPGSAPGLAGSYRLDAINTRPLPAESPTEQGVMLERGTLTLEPGGRYTLQVAARIRQQPEPTAPVVRGTYVVEGDALALTPDAEVPASAVRFRFVRDGGTLRLRDERGNELAFARQ